MNNNLQKLEEFVCDEDKIVTVSWLSKTLAITAKDAKALLNEYISNSRKSQPGSLFVLYLLSGLRENTLTVSLAKDDELDDKKDLYTKDPIVEVYSIQKSKEVDFNSVALVDCFNTNDCRISPLLGSIISKNCIKRNFKPKKALPPPPPATVKEKTSFFTKLPTKPTINNATTITNNSLPTSKPSNAKVTQSPKQSAFGRFFTNGDQKPVKKETVTPTTKATEKSSFDRFFTNGDQKSAKDDTDSPIKKKTVDTKINSKKILSSLVDSDSDSESVSQQQTVKTNGKEKQVKRPAKKKGSAAKRRKRIVVEEESDDDIFADDDEDEEEKSRKRKNVITDSDEEQPVVKPEPIPELPKNKRRKLVDRTFTDEEGFVITKKEWVEEDVSENDEVKVTENKTEPQVKKQVNNAANEEKTKKTSPPKNEKSSKIQKGKKVVPVNQTTLMSFFKRK